MACATAARRRVHTRSCAIASRPPQPKMHPGRPCAITPMSPSHSPQRGGEPLTPGPARARAASTDDRCACSGDIPGGPGRHLRTRSASARRKPAGASAASILWISFFCIFFARASPALNSQNHVRTKLGSLSPQAASSKSAAIGAASHPTARRSPPPSPRGHHTPPRRASSRSPCRHAPGKCAAARIMGMGYLYQRCMRSARQCGRHAQHCALSDGTGPGLHPVEGASTARGYSPVAATSVRPRGARRQEARRPEESQAARRGLGRPPRSVMARQMSSSGCARRTGPGTIPRRAGDRAGREGWTEGSRGRSEGNGREDTSRVRANRKR